MTEFAVAEGDVGRAGALDLRRLVFEAGVLRIALAADDGAVWEMRFDAPLLFRRMDEGDALGTLGDLARSGGAGQSLYEARGSALVAGFVAETQGLAQARDCGILRCARRTM